MERKVFALVGAYGSGKTEISLNMAKKLSNTNKTVLADLDIVNPYFRSSEKIEQMNSFGVEVITPVLANTTIDSPMLSPKVGGYFLYKDINYILDVGGDPVGAKALGQFRHKLRENGGKIYYVVNTFRPFTKDENSIIDMINKIKDSTSEKIDGIIHNSNMGINASYNDLIHGKKIVDNVSNELNIPVILTCGTKDVLKKFKEQTNFSEDTFVIDRFMELTF